MSVTYVVRSPIHGYSSMGYESLSHIEREFTDEAAASKHLRRCNTAWEIQERVGKPGHPCLTDREEAFLREMTDVVSYSFRGPSQLIRRTVTEEVIV